MFRIKRIAIGKCDLFSHYCDAKEIFYYFSDIKLGAKHEKTHATSIHIVRIMFVRPVNCALQI